ncbi:hypothetical protein DFH28DRAFT_833693, partial [Melampsora americana]
PPSADEVDIDGYNISVTPECLIHYLSIKGNVTLGFRDLNIRDDEYFSDWVYVASGSVEVRISPRFKASLLFCLKDKYHYAIEANVAKSTAFTQGSQHVTSIVFIQALLEVGVEHVRLSCYGQKAPYRLFSFNLGGEVDVPCKRNTFDIGFTSILDHIVVAQHAYHHSKLPMETHPMLLELGQGYGSIRFKTFIKDHPVIVKGYPRLVHSLKSIRWQDLAHSPATTRTWLSRVNSVERKIKALDDKKPQELGGWRFEVTIQVATLKEAVELVVDSGLLHMQTY